jgi:D-arabinose 1-dehydrogenase-like Zn-dependent alcohol dehydrogenase
MGSPSELTAYALTGDVEKDSAGLIAIAGAPGADVYIDFSPPEAGEGGKTPPHLLAAFGALRPHGTALLMGGTFGMVSIPYGLVMFKNLVVQGRFMYERAQLQKVIKLAEQGRLKLGKKVGKTVIGPYGIDDIVEAMEVAEKNPGYANTVILRP